MVTYAGPTLGAQIRSFCSVGDQVIWGWAAVRGASCGRPFSPGSWHPVMRADDESAPAAAWPGRRVLPAAGVRRWLRPSREGLTPVEGPACPDRQPGHALACSRVSHWRFSFRILS